MTFPLDRTALALTALLAVAACRGEDPGTSDPGSTTASTTTTGDDETTVTPLPTTGDGTTGPVDPSTTTSGAGTSTTDNSAGFITTNSTTDPSGGEPQENGAQCGDDSECLSMHCFTSPLGMGMGVCSECAVDQDCADAGTGISCSADLLSMQAVCKPGNPGDQCMSTDACMPGLFCEPVIDGLMGLLPNTCSECASSDDCMMDDICSPVLDTGALSGDKQCVAPGSVADNGLCPSDMAEGDAACMSGHCSDVDVMGFLKVPVCGACETDADCAMDEKCTVGAFDFNNMGFTGSTCG